MYSKEFKQQALELSDEIGTKEACKQLGVSYGTLTDWRKAKNRLAIEGKGKGGSAVTYTQDDVDDLVKENEELQKSVKILKDALRFFANDRKKK